MRIFPINKEQENYAQYIFKLIRDKGLYCEVWDSSSTIEKRIRTALKDKDSVDNSNIVMIIIGPREMETSSFNLRIDNLELKGLSVKHFL